MLKATPSEGGSHPPASIEAGPDIVARDGDVDFAIVEGLDPGAGRPGHGRICCGGDAEPNQFVSIGHRPGLDVTAGPPDPSRHKPVAFVEVRRSGKKPPSAKQGTPW